MNRTGLSIIFFTHLQGVEVILIGLLVQGSYRPIIYPQLEEVHSAKDEEKANVPSLDLGASHLAGKKGSDQIVR
ncbi:hypothetical protein T265_02618 [Opisthorchis viverrini]|uniref:Uncharacterized protein n=1 Tax=Opisthorchis viverrini TaxID=6198 RepID=A0A075AI57_OPIVI|nr:hypothetical protein T265_02618 [Opisthorchis viverrini]KER31054.1 hypothetical protein T265_02618 [Opisthorchis viverrini]